MVSTYAMLDLDAYVGDIQGHYSFPLLDELNSRIAAIAADHPGSARLRRVGTSRRGEPLNLLTVGTGSRNILMTGGPHPNEPVGFHTVIETARLVTEAPELAGGSGYTWHFLPCSDPDGARLNEGWYAAPLDISTYHRNFFRPAFMDQPEWMFPMGRGATSGLEPLPETRALMRVIDRVRPYMQFSLHNSDFGGAYFILNRAHPDLAEPLKATAEQHGIPLETDPTDADGWPRLGSGVSVMAPATSAIPAAENGAARRHGASSGHYADRHHTLTLITEVPLWRVWDVLRPGTSYGEVLSSAADDLYAMERLVTGSLRRVAADLTLATPFLPAVADTVTSARGVARAWREKARSWAAARPATPGEYTGARTTARQFPLRTLGMLLRHLRAELAAGNQAPAIGAELEVLDDRFSAWCERAQREARATPYPVSDLVAVQVRAALTAAAVCR
ncbi:MAG: M14 family zinc carboxypeptidase [Actinomadura sp.]